MARFLVLTTIKPPTVPLDNDLTYPIVYRIVGDPDWEVVNGYCKYLSKYPHTTGAGHTPAPLLPVAGLEFQTEHIATDVATAAADAQTWVTNRVAGWGVPSVWAITGRVIYTMSGDIIGNTNIDSKIAPVSL